MAQSGAQSLSSEVQLNDGVTMPLYGIGTYTIPGGGATKEVVMQALRLGYRLIDTAQYYKNEADVGEAFKLSGLKRKDVFIVSKLSGENHGEEACVEAVHRSLRDLDLDYIDLFLIHSPKGGKLVETYNALLRLKEQGLIRSLGVSNFNIHHLEGIRKSGCTVPSVNQFELHPFQPREELVSYCREQGIMVMGYSPLVRCHKNDDPTLKTIANRHNKTVPQILLRWSLQKGYITIPKTEKLERLKSNSEVFDFSLTEQDLKEMGSVPSYICAWNPLVLPFEG